jgi:hypothetical protein
MRPTSFLLPLLFLFGSACNSVCNVDGLRDDESARETARETDALFPGAIPTDEDGRETWVVTRIVDAASGEPLPGAILDAVRERRPAPLRWKPVRRAVADREGWARLRVEDTRDEFSWYFVSAPGHADHADMSAPGP